MLVSGKEIQRKDTSHTPWLVVSTHSKNMLVKMGSSSPKFGVKINKYLSCHHLAAWFFFTPKTHGNELHQLDALAQRASGLDLRSHRPRSQVHGFEPQQPSTPQPTPRQYKKGYCNFEKKIQGKPTRSLGDLYY